MFVSNMVFLLIDKVEDSLFFRIVTISKFAAYQFI